LRWRREGGIKGERYGEGGEERMRVLFILDTLHLFGLGLEGLGNLWRFPGLGNTS